MELWIRSQDKKKLYNVKNLELDNLETGICYESRDVFVLLGKYKTKERALEVLDEIQNQLMKKDKNNTELTYEIVNMANNEEKIIILKQCDLLYEMPKE